MESARPEFFWVICVGNALRQFTTKKSLCCTQSTYKENETEPKIVKLKLSTYFVFQDLDVWTIKT